MDPKKLNESLDNILISSMTSAKMVEAVEKLFEDLAIASDNDPIKKRKEDAAKYISQSVKREKKVPYAQVLLAKLREERKDIASDLEAAKVEPLDDGGKHYALITFPSSKVRAIAHMALSKMKDVLLKDTLIPGDKKSVAIVLESEEKVD